MPLGGRSESSSGQLYGSCGRSLRYELTYRWKPLEAALALLGGLSDDIRDRLETEQEEGVSRSIDLGYLFDQVIPGLLDQSGQRSET